MTIYIDVILIENILLNYIILVATALIGKCEIKYIRILISSILGSIFAILNYIVLMNFIQNLVFKVIISCLMIFIAYNNKKVANFFKNLMMFYLTSFTFGGAAFMLLFFIKPENIIFEAGHFVGTYPIKIAIFGGILGFILIDIISKIIKDRLDIKNMLCDLEICYKDKNVKIKTLVDTGNLLKEPITMLDVIIVEKDRLIGIVDDEILMNIKEIINGKWIGKMAESIYDYKLKLVPFSSLGNENGVLLGFRPDYIKVYDEKTYIKRNVIVGIYDGKLSKTSMYASLIGANILKEEKENESVAIY